MTKKDINKVWIEFGTVRCDIFWFWFLNLFLTHYSGKPVIISGVPLHICIELYCMSNIASAVFLWPGGSRVVTLRGTES